MTPGAVMITVKSEPDPCNDIDLWSIECIRCEGSTTHLAVETCQHVEQTRVALQPRLGAGF